MDNMTFGKYIPGNSIIHRLDPRLKICAVFIFLISVFFDAGFIGYGILAIYVLLCSLVSKIKLSHILKAIKPMVFMMLFLMIFNIFLMKTGDVIIKIGNISIYSGALLQTAYIFIRLVLIITLTTLMTSTTKPLELTLAIESLLNPLKRFHFPVHELAMMISIALRFIPDLLDEAKRIMKAQASRGADFNEGSFMEKIKSIISLTCCIIHIHFFNNNAIFIVTAKSPRYSFFFHFTILCWIPCNLKSRNICIYHR